MKWDTGTSSHQRSQVSWEKAMIKDGIGASLVAQAAKNLSAMQEAQVDPWVGKIP